MGTDRDGINFVVIFTGDQEDGGQRVVSLEENKLAVVTLLETLVLIFMHIFRFFAKGDGTRKVR